MKTTVKSKEQLQKEVVEKEMTIIESITGDENRRREFARVFGYFEGSDSFGFRSSERKPSLITWAQIFVELGKLISIKELKNYEDIIKNLDNQIYELKNKKTKDVEPM